MDLSLFQTVDQGGNQVEAQRPEAKSLDDVQRVINKHAGNNDSVVDRFIDMYLLGEQWSWYEDQYKPWLKKCEQIETDNGQRTADDEGNMPEPTPLPEMPTQPEQTTKEIWKKQNYAILRKAAYGPAGEQLDKMHPGTERWITDWLPYVDEVQKKYPS